MRPKHAAAETRPRWYAACQSLAAAARAVDGGIHPGPSPATASAAKVCHPQGLSACQPEGKKAGEIIGTRYGHARSAHRAEDRAAPHRG